MSQSEFESTGDTGGGGSAWTNTDWNAQQFVTNGSPDFLRIAAVIVSSYILAVFSGLVDIIFGAGSAVAQLISAPLNWAASALSYTLQTVEGTLAGAWLETLGVFPITGGLDWAIAVVVIGLFLTFVGWVWDNLREVV